MNKLVVLGSVNADHILQVPSFPRPGETLLGKGYRVIPGGKGANQAVAAARLGADVAFIACVGDDGFGLNMRQAFAKDGINIDAVIVEPDTPTGIAMIQVAESGENSICISAEANACLLPAKLALHRQSIINADMLLMQLETPIETIIDAAEMAHEADTLVILNPAPAQFIPDKLLGLIDIITPNETEAEQLTGVVVNSLASAKHAADLLHKKGIELVIITLGNQGVWVSKNFSGKQIKGFQVKAIDTTAAGDTFNGALLTALLEDKNLNDSIVFAHAAAALTVKKMGAQTSIPYRVKVEQFLNNI